MLWWGGSYAAAVTVVAAAVVLTSRWPDPITVVLFGALLILAECSATMLPTTRVSPRFMIVMAAIAALHGHGVVLGATFIGLCSGPTITQLRQRRFRVLLFNWSQSVLC